MFSIDCTVSLQLYQADLKAVERRVPVVSNILAGKSVRLLMLFQLPPKFSPDEKSRDGKALISAQDCQAAPNSTPLEVSSTGKLSSPEQLIQVV